MVILFADRKSRTEKDIIKILTSIGADYISDSSVHSLNGKFTIISEYKKTELKLNRGIAVFCDDTERFKNQLLPEGIIGICEDTNTGALELFQKNRIPVISCGISGKNTVTLSSFGDDTLHLSLRRSFMSNNGTEIEPTDFKIKLKENYSPFAVMASVAVLLLKGIIPKEL